MAISHRKGVAVISDEISDKRLSLSESNSFLLQRLQGSFSFQEKNQKCTSMFIVKTTEAKFWLEPTVSLARNHNLSERQINEIKSILEERKDTIEESWRKHFGN